MKAREERIRHLGGLTLEMYRRSSFRDQLLIEHCREIVALEDRLRELDSMLEAVATARRAPTTCECGAPVPWGSHFCANCGRPVGAEAVVACEGCGHPLSADATFCAHCGRPVETSDEAEPEAELGTEAGSRRIAGRRDDPALVRSLGALSGAARGRPALPALRHAVQRRPGVLPRMR